MIAVVDYGSGNVRAVLNIYERLGICAKLASRPEELIAAERLILPGVGAFDQAMRELEQSGLRAALDECILRRGKLVLGICVGMQLLANGSEEGTLRGLGWIEGFVRKFNTHESGRRVPLPHMGWNTAEPVRRDPLFEDVDWRGGFYFLHSYYFACRHSTDALAMTEYGGSYVSAVRRRNIYGVQFHPEKSHAAGVRLLENFARLQSPAEEAEHPPSDCS